MNSSTYPTNTESITCTRTRDEGKRIRNVASALVEHSLVRIKVSVADDGLITEASPLLCGRDTEKYNSQSPVCLGVVMSRALVNGL